MLSIISNFRTNKTIRHGVLFSIYSFISKGVTFVLLILLANYIMPTEYGLLSLFSTTFMLVGYFIDLSTRGYLSVSFFQADKESFKKDFSAICVITLMVSMIFSIVLGVFHEPLSKLLKLDSILLWLCIMIAFCTVFISLNLDYLRLQEKVSLYGVLSCLFAVINMAFSLYLVISKDLNWKGRIYAQVICDGVFLIIALVWFYKDHLFCLPKDIDRYKKIIYWGLPIIPHLASNWIRQGCDRYIIEGSHSMADVGVFSFALNLVTIIITIGTAFNATNSVDLYKVLASDSDEHSKKAHLKRTERMMYFVYGGAAFFITLSCILFVPIALPHYVDSLPYFVILSIYGFMQCIYFLYCNYLFYFSRTRQLMYITFGCSILHLLLSLCLTKYSLYWTSAIYVISFSLMTLLVRKKAREVYPI